MCNTREENAAELSQEEQETYQPSEVLQSIVDILDGTEWSVEMLDAIADVLRAAGYPIRDIEEA